MCHRQNYRIGDFLIGLVVYTFCAWGFMAAMVGVAHVLGPL